MELSRRDAVAALLAAGGLSGATALTWDALDGEGDGEGFDRHERESLVALAEVLYPEAVTGVPEFVESYVVGRARDRPADAAGMAESLAELDERARDWTGTPWLELTPTERDAFLRDLGLDEADPDPHGLAYERMRYYLVNELLFALYSSPTGGELVGIENPVGHPGGTASYQRPPPDGEMPRGDAHGSNDEQTTNTRSERATDAQSEQTTKTRSEQATDARR